MNILLFLLLLAVTLIVIYTLTNGIGPVPSNRKVINSLQNVLPEQVQGTIVELGAGWGKVMVYLARRYPEQNVIAVENCPPVWLVCWLRAKLSRAANLKVKLGCIYREDLDNAGLIYCYLYPGAMEKLVPRLQQVQPGCVVISNTFSLPGHEPEGLSHANDLWRSRIYRYRLSQ